MTPKVATAIKNILLDLKQGYLRKKNDSDNTGRRLCAILKVILQNILCYHYPWNEEINVQNW